MCSNDCLHALDGDCDDGAEPTAKTALGREQDLSRKTGDVICEQALNQALLTAVVYVGEAAA